MLVNIVKNLETWIKRVHKKYKQLPPDAGGIIIANSSNTWDPQDIDVVLKTSWRETKEGQKSRIVGIIFWVRHMLGIPSTSGGIVNFISLRFLINPYSKFEYSKELEEMAKVLGIYPDWM